MRKEKSFDVHRSPMGEEPPAAVKSPPLPLIGAFVLLAFTIVGAVLAIALLR